MNTGWTVQIQKHAQKSLNNLSDIERTRIHHALQNMISYYEKGTGIQPDLKKLKGKYHGLLRLRVGYLWIILKIVQSALVVLVIDVIHRKDAYQ